MPVQILPPIPTARELSEEAHAASIAHEKDPANEALARAAKKAHMVAAIARTAAADRCHRNHEMSVEDVLTHHRAAQQHYRLAGCGDLLK